MRIHLHLPRLASCLFWPIAKSGFNTMFFNTLIEPAIPKSQNPDSLFPPPGDSRLRASLAS